MGADFMIFLDPPLAAQLRFDNSSEIKYRLGADRHCVVNPGRQVGAEAMESDGGLLTNVNLVRSPWNTLAVRAIFSPNHGNE